MLATVCVCTYYTGELISDLSPSSLVIQYTLELGDGRIDTSTPDQAWQGTDKAELRENCLNSSSLCIRVGVHHKARNARGLLAELSFGLIREVNRAGVRSTRGLIVIFVENNRRRVSGRAAGLQK